MFGQLTLKIALLVDLQNVANRMLFDAVSYCLGLGNTVAAYTYFTSSDETQNGHFVSELEAIGVTPRLVDEPFRGAEAVDKAIAFDSADVYHTLSPDVIFFMTGDYGHMDNLYRLREKGVVLVAVSIKKKINYNYSNMFDLFIELSDCIKVHGNDTELDDKEYLKLQCLIRDIYRKNKKTDGLVKIDTIAQELVDRYGFRSKVVCKKSIKKLINSLNSFFVVTISADETVVMSVGERCLL